MDELATIPIDVLDQQSRPSDAPVQRVPVDAWEWIAQYDDGTYLQEWNDDGTLNGWKDIDKERFARFILLPMREGLTPHVLDGPWGGEHNRRPIWFRRHAIEMDYSSGGELSRTTKHVYGWQVTVGGVNIATYTVLFEDGSVLVTSNADAF